MHQLRRKEKAMNDPAEMISVLKEAEHVTIAISLSDEPYLVTLNHVYDESQECIYFHCAKEGRKVEILRGNNRVWGQALLDGGYKQGSCDYLFKTTQFSGRVTFVEDTNEKKHILKMMIRKLDKNPEKVIAEQITPKCLEEVMIGRIDISFMTGKKSTKV